MLIFVFIFHSDLKTACSKSWGCQEKPTEEKGKTFSVNYRWTCKIIVMIWLVVQCAILLTPNNLWYVLYIFLYCFFKLFFLFIQAYVQQLESSRLKLTQLEQELQRARQQVCFCSSILFCPLKFWYLLFEVPFFVSFHSLDSVTT